MRRIADGDRAALAAFYDRHSPAVFTLGLRVLRGREDAEDLLVDVFYEIWDRRERFDPTRGSPLTYLLTLARSRAIDRLRSRRSSLTDPLDTDSLSEPASPGTSGSALEDSVVRESAELVRDALGQLEPAQRQAIECAYYDGLSHSEIADRLRKPLGTIKTHIRVGLIQLRDALRSTKGERAQP